MSPENRARVLDAVPGWAGLREAAHFHDHYAAEGAGGLPHFMARAFSYAPGWLRTLYALRRPLAAALGLDHATMLEPDLRPETVPFTPGARLAVFEVVAADPARYWLGRYPNKRLTVHLAILCEPLDKRRGDAVDRARFHMGSAIRYSDARALMYFNLVRPVHGLVFQRMVRAGAGDLA